jgi:ATP-binding cassette subfamily B protein
LQQPRVLILDEATSCLDAAGEAAVLECIRSRLRTATLLVVSHRLSTFSAFRRVLILSAGRIVDNCAPDALLGVQNATSRLAASDTADSHELHL